MKTWVEENKTCCKNPRVAIISWRVANAVMFVFLACCAGVQANDPDPWLWIPLYGVPAISLLVISIAPNIQETLAWRIISSVDLIYCLAMFVYTVMFITEETKSALHGNNPLLYEEGREVAGLVIVFSWIFLALLYNPNVKRKESMSRCMKVTIITAITTLPLLPALLWLICYVSVLSQYIRFCTLMCGDKTGSEL